MDQGTLALDREDSKFRNRHAPQPPPSPETQSPQIPRPRDFEEAMRNPMESWPAYRITFPMGDPTRLPRNPIPHPTFEGVHPNHVFVRDEQDPVPRALVASGAQRVDHWGLRVLGGGGLLATSLATLPFEAWRVDNHLV